MPRGPKGITAEQMHEVCEKLTAAGTRPSIKSIRRILGKGSETTILNHLNAWKRNQE